MRVKIVLVMVVFCALCRPALAAPGGAASPSPTTTPLPTTVTPIPPASATTPDLIEELKRVVAEINDRFAKGDMPGTLDSLMKELDLCRRMKDRACEGSALGDIAYVYDAMGRYTQALNYYQQCLTIKREVKDQTGAAVTLNNIGLDYRLLGQFDQALATYDQALALWLALGDKSGEGTTLNNIGTTYVALSEYKRGLDYFNKSLPLIRQAKERDNEARTINNIGLVYQNLGQYPEALQNFEQALSIARELKNQEDQAILLGNIGVLYQAIGDYPKALDYLNQDLAISKTFSNPSSQAVTLNNLAVVYDNMGQYAKAIELYQQALVIVRDQSDQPNLAAALGNLGLSYDNIQQYDQAIDYIQQSLNLARKIGDRRSEGTALSNLGTVYYDMGSYTKALQYTQQALPIMQQVNDPLAVSKIITNIGKAHEGAGDLQKALESYQQAINLREGVRSTAGLEEFKTSLAEQSATVYERAILLLMRLNRPAEAFDLTEHARARTFLDQLGNAHINVRQGADAQLVQQEQDLRLALQTLQRKMAEQSGLPQDQQNVEVVRSLQAQINTKQQAYADLLTRIKLSNPEYASLVSISPLSLAQTQQRLDRDTTLLDYFVTVSTTVAFVITRDSFTAMTLTVSQADLRSAIEQFRRFDDLGNPVPDTLRQLSRWLIDPLKAQLRTPVLGIIPNGILHYLPFAALPMPSSNGGKIRYLADDYTIFHLPSASVLPYVQAKHKGDDQPLSSGSQSSGSQSSTSQSSGTALALAMSSPPGFESLQYADSEARNIASLFNAQALVNEAATETRFDTQAGQNRIVHIAAHGEYNEANSLFSRIMLAPDDKNDGSLEVNEVYGLDLKRTDLVVLSACNTQLGKQSAGDDIVGLNRAFIYAGAPTVVASLWSVNDEATGYFMQSFYKHLKDGAGKAQSLRDAQSDTRAKYPNPYYWAAFVLTGDPGSAPTREAPAVVWILAGVAILALAGAGWFILHRRSKAIRRTPAQDQG